MLDLHLSTAPYGVDQTLTCCKESNMRKSKYILIACLAVIQVTLVFRFAAAAPMAHGVFNGVDAPEWSVPGGRLVFSATALNDGDSTGWFRICFIRFGPSYHEYFPNPLDQVREEWAVHCSKTLPTDPGQRMTFQSNKFRMMSVPNETFWILLTVQQQAPIPGSEDGTDFTNLTIDELRVQVVTNLYG
jgi:hypothetical protein